MKPTLLLLFYILPFTFCISQPTSWSSRGIGGGGALFSPSINPANNNEYFISCDMSELFHTNDFGLNYSQVNFTELQGGHNSRVAYTLAGTLYCVNYDDDMALPVKSTDGGNTWSTLSGNPDPSETVYTIHANYNNSNQVLISYYGELYFSNNSGISFTSIHTAATGQGIVVGGVLFEGTNIYIGTNDGVLVSTNSGTSFNLVTITGIPTTDAIWSFCAAKSGGTTRFFCLTANTGDIYTGLQGSDYWDFMTGVYRCDYGSTQWVSVTNGINIGSDFPMFIDMAENDINTVYLAGSNDITEPIILKTTNAGANWNHVFTTSSNGNIATGWSGQGGDRGWSYGECPFGFDVAANDPDYLIFGDFGFVHKTSDGGLNWNQAYVDTAHENPAGSNTPVKQEYESVGIENTTCWQVTWSDANNMFACFSDIRGIRSTDAGTSWSFNYSGHTANSMYRIAKTSTGTLIAATSGVHDMYQSTRLADNILDAADPNGKLIYSTDNGLTWNLLHQFNSPCFWVVIDPNNPNRAYASVIQYSGGAGIGGVYRCDDLNNLGSSTWTLINNTVSRTQKHPASLEVLNDGTLVATYSGRRDGSGVFTNSSGIFTYNPTSGNWTDVSDPGMHYWTKDVVIDPNDASQNTWYVCVFSGWGGAPNGLGGLYKTTNRGTNWTRINSLDRVTSITFNPNNADEIYMTTEQDGLWMSSDINASTPTFSQVANYPFRQPERVFFNPFDANEIWVTSFGNGMKMGTLVANGITFTEEENISVYPNPASTRLNFDFGNLITENISVEIFDMSGRLVKSVRMNGNESLNIENLEKGGYLLKTNINEINFCLKWWKE